MITEKDIRKLLQDINKSKADGQVITRPLTDKVEYVKIWLDDAFSENKINEPSTGYLIRDKDSLYWGAVLVDASLCWYVLPQYRKGKLFSDLLREIIIPHILQHKPVLWLTISQAEYSVKEFSYMKKIALASGFKIIRDNGKELKMAIEAASLGKREYISGKNTGLSERRKKEISRTITSFIQKLRFFELEITLKTANLEAVEDFKEVEERLERLNLNLRNQK